MREKLSAALLPPHRQTIRRLVHSRLRSDQADDALQQTLLRAFARRHQLRSHDKFKSWLWSIAINEGRMLLRASRPTISIDEFAHFEYTDQRPSPHALYEARERTEQVHAGLSKLNHRDRTALHFADLNDMTAREAAAARRVSAAAASPPTHPPRAQ